LGEFEKSIEASKKSQELNPELSPVRFNLGLAYLCSGDLERGRIAYREAMEKADAPTLKTDGIDDLAKVIRNKPGLPGASEILEEMTTRYDAFTAATVTLRSNYKRPAPPPRDK
jgi:tetratricopeptide (TPR) repeat protein